MPPYSNYDIIVRIWGRLFMKIRNHIIILITMIVSAGYIFGIDYYDTKETKIQEIYKDIALPGIVYRNINIELNGIKEGEQLDARAMADKQNQTIMELSHLGSCSKLCTQIHKSNVYTEVIKEKDTLGILVTSKDAEPSYTALIKNQKDIGYNTYYRIKIQGIQGIQDIQGISKADNLRNRSYHLFEKWHVKPKESIAFTGTMAGKLTTSQRKEWIKTLFKALKASQRGYYLDDYSKDTEAYYGYTKAIKDYFIDNNGKKTNLHISFSYNEYEHTTQMIIAFPFYNEPF